MDKRKIGILKHAFLKDPYKKPIILMVFELFKLWIYKKTLPRHYLVNMLYRKGIGNIQKYLSTKENNQILAWSQKMGRASLKQSEDKAIFEELLKKNNIRTPKIYLFNRENTFFYSEGKRCIKDHHQLSDIIEAIFEKENVLALFCKPTMGNQGKNIFKIGIQDYRERIQEYFDKIISYGYVFQEVVQQHRSLDKINPYNLCTLRMVTYKDAKNHIEILSGFIRFGRKEAIVDNAHAGGIVVGFDRDTGILRKDGLRLIENGGGVFHQHPDTLERFEGFRLPRYDEVISIVKKAAPLFDFPILGWDVAITNDAVVIVEVNQALHLMLSDRIEGGYLKNPTFKEILEAVQSPG